MAKKRGCRVGDNFERARLETLKRQMEEAGVMMDGLLKGNPIVDRIMRDTFAGHCAAASCWASDGSQLWSPEQIAKRAFAVARAMMVERKKQKD
jgi:hypothetical protein